MSTAQSLAFLVIALSGLIILTAVCSSMRLVQISIVLFGIVPIGYMALPNSVGRYLTPSIILLLLAAIKQLFRPPASGSPVRGRVSTVLTVMWTAFGLGVILTFSTSFDVSRSLLWLIVCVGGLTSALYVGATHDGQPWEYMKDALSIVAIIIGLVSLADYVIGINPWDYILDARFADRDWSTFRSKSTMGHPLLVSAQAVVCLVAALFDPEPLKRDRQTFYFRVAAIASASVALLLSVSRTGILSLACALAVIFVSGVINFALQRRKDVAVKDRLSNLRWLAAALLIGFAVLSPLLALRNQSTGGSGSAEYRLQIIQSAHRIVVDHIFVGTGPGTGSFIFSNATGLSLENSWLQFAISFGLIGTVIFTGLILIGLIYLVVQGQGVYAGLIVSVLVSAAGFNIGENNPAALIMLVCPVVIGIGHRLSDRRRPIVSSRSLVLGNRWA